ncbi:MAG: hypothetical protein LBD42_02010 [Desulfovibrio sp.]|jgi:uncharacterized coiled-coil protein SlyX|nr:hypothetical protein [Desulfovibrio sp.]
MSKNEPSTPNKALDATRVVADADDDVVDLLEIVKPGRSPAQHAGIDEEDFSADLDAMLDDLSDDKTPSAGASNRPMPFPDPTPVDHTVDHDESLELPGMDDVDKLLRSFGASQKDSVQESDDEPDFAIGNPDMPDLDALPTALTTPKKNSPPPIPSGNVNAPPSAAKADAPQKSPPIPDDDALFAALLAESTSSPAGEETAAPAKAAAAPDGDLFADLDSILTGDDQDDVSPPDDSVHAGSDTAADKKKPDGRLAGGTPAGSATPAPAAGDRVSLGDMERFLPEDAIPPLSDAGYAEADSSDAEGIAPPPQTPAAPAPQRQNSSQQADAADFPPHDAAYGAETQSSRFDGVDLNELDALLDNMLATAPVSGPVPTAAGATNDSGVADEAPLAPQPAPPSLLSSPDIQALQAQVSEQESIIAEQADKVRVLQQDLAALSAEAGEHRESIAGCSSEVQELVQRFSGACDHIQVLEQSVKTLANAAPDEGKNLADDSRITVLANRIQLLEEQLAERDAQLQALETRVADLLANMDSLAAETAARVIREELAALTESLA